MRGKRIWKRWICAILVFTLLAAMPGGASAAEKPEWRYGDSLLVHVFVNETRDFSPKDFPDIDCEKVYVLEKNQREAGIEYQLVLMLSQPRKIKISEAIKRVKQLPMVVDAEYNNKYVSKGSQLILNRSYLYLAVNEAAEIKVQSVNFNGNFERIYGIQFKVDSSYYNEDMFTVDSFSAYKVSCFWPRVQGKLWCILLPDSRPEELEAQKSADGVYYGLAGERNEYVFEAVKQLAAVPGILQVSIVRAELIGEETYGNRQEKTLRNDTNESNGEKYAGFWNIKNTNVASLTLLGESTAPNVSVNNAASVCGLTKGVSLLTCERSYYDTYAISSCPVIVYEPGSKNNPGDINHDGTISAEDALQALKHTVGLELLDENGKQTADLNDDGAVNAEDALLMLKIAIGSL